MTTTRLTIILITICRSIQPTSRFQPYPGLSASWRPPTNRSIPTRRSEIWNMPLPPISAHMRARVTRMTSAMARPAPTIRLGAIADRSIQTHCSRYFPLSGVKTSPLRSEPSLSTACNSSRTLRLPIRATPSAFIRAMCRGGRLGL